jgi:hypothetical protein
MRYGLLVLTVCLGMLFYLGLYVASSDDALDFDPLRPSSILPIMGRGVHALFVRVRDVGQALTDAVGNPQRERVQRHLPIEAVHQ